MVVEDSCWPSDALTPQRVYAELQKRRRKALWLAAKRHHRTYTHSICTKTVSAKAAAGSKCFVGNKAFWGKVNTLFETTDKHASTDSVFQRMVGLGDLDFVHPLLGATMPHFSERTGKVDYHDLVESDIDGNLLPLPGGFLKSLHETAKQ